MLRLSASGVFRSRPVASNTFPSFDGAWADMQFRKDTSQVEAEIETLRAAGLPD